MHVHSQKEKCQQEVMDAFKAHDKTRRGVVNGPDLYHILTQYGEKLDRQEGMKTALLLSCVVLHAFGFLV